MKKALIVGCGLSGAVIARELAEDGYQVTILERRDHIGGNMYDYRDPYGILVHKYGPHTFHTEKAELYHYICRFSDWEEYRLTCGAEINGICTPTPFNYQTIDDFYPPERVLYPRRTQKNRTWKNGGDRAGEPTGEDERRLGVCAGDCRKGAELENRL